MKTLYEAFRKLKSSYYDIKIDVDTLFEANNAGIRCSELIRKHFEKGNKKGIFHLPDKCSYEHSIYGKPIHTVSLYLLGLLLKRRFNSILRTELSKHFDISEWYNYEYTWYLTCLYHDELNFLEHKNRYNDEIYDVSDSELLNGNYTFIRFKKDIYINYLKYRKASKTSEHGIVAGVDLFKRLYNSFDTETAGHDWITNKVYKKNNLTWRKEHLPHFAYICDAICCHNIWLVNEKDDKMRNIYIDANLEELIIRSNSDKLQLEQYPLQFLLCLLDTIEPIKKFGDLEPIEVFKNIFIEVKTNGSITIGWTNVIKKQSNFFKWLDSIYSLNDWMGVNVCTCYHEDDKCFINIYF